MTEFGERQPDIEYRDRYGASGIAIRDNKILIELAPLGYFLPGGGIDPGETPEEGLRREFIEETGFELTEVTPIGTAAEYLYIEQIGVHWKRIDYFFRVELGAKGDPTYADGHVYPVEWLDIEEVRGKMFLKTQGWGIEQALAANT